ncbi:hypothetical protein ACP26L_36600 (plasmid) [Paenibacillus sp. S-38]|uniref:hypothetical protein n=1 Tax=Paenibacillus sp. S-38 TaxID=3416710 RepID=UPI003CF38D49
MPSMTSFVFIVVLSSKAQTTVTVEARACSAATRKVKKMYPGYPVYHQGLS